MSWNGTHPVIDRTKAKALLPLGACRWCVYKMQVFHARFINEAGGVVFFPKCDRCGVEIVRQKGR